MYITKKIPQLRIQARQSSGVTCRKLSNSKASQSLVWTNSFSIDFIDCFTLENVSSIGLKSGEYGGKKCISAPTSCIDFTTSGTWWILQLSIMITEWGFVPLYGISCGMRWVCTKLQKVSPSLVPVRVFTSNRPAIDIQAMADTRLPRTKKEWFLSGLPLMLYPCLRTSMGGGDVREPDWCMIYIRFLNNVARTWKSSILLVVISITIYGYRIQFIGYRANHRYYSLRKQDWKLLTWAIRLCMWWLRTLCYDWGWWLCWVLCALVF